MQAFAIKTNKSDYPFPVIADGFKSTVEVLHQQGIFDTDIISVDGGRIHTQTYTWNLKRLKPTGYLRELGSIKTYHTGSRFFFKPSVDECVYQCPYPEATAFMVVPGSGDYDYALGCWEAETIYYAGTMPDDIRNREIEW